MIRVKKITNRLCKVCPRDQNVIIVLFNTLFDEYNNSYIELDNTFPVKTLLKMNF